MKFFLHSQFCKLRMLACYAIFLLSNIVFIFIAVLISVLTAFNKKSARKFLDFSLQNLLRFLSFGIFSLVEGYKVSVSGVENISRSPAIYAMNHISYLDPLFALALLSNAGIVVKGKYDSILAIWILTRFFDFVSIGNGGREEVEIALAKIEELVKSGRNIVIFPEGTRSPNGRLGDFKSLSFRLSRQTGLPIIPIAIASSVPFLSRGTSLFPVHNGVVFDISILKSLSPRDFDSAQSLSIATYSKIAREIKKMRQNISEKS